MSPRAMETAVVLVTVLVFIGVDMTRLGFSGLSFAVLVRQLRHHFGPNFAHFSAPPHPARGVYHALLGAHADRVLIGAWNAML